MSRSTLNTNLKMKTYKKLWNMIDLKNNVNRKNVIRMIQVANSSNSYAGPLEIHSPNSRGKKFVEIPIAPKY